MSKLLSKSLGAFSLEHFIELKQGEVLFTFYVPLFCKKVFLKEYSDLNVFFLQKIQD
jgi:hypothetical protein